MPTTLTPQNRPDLWRGAIDWQVRADGAALAWRLRRDLADWAFDQTLLDVAMMASGVHARVRTSAASLRFGCEFQYETPGVLDVLVDGEVYHRTEVAPGEFSLTLDLPAGEHDVELWLPQVGFTWVRHVDLDADAESVAAPSTRWVTYGSSISQCSASAGPSRVWPAIVARNLGWDLTNLGLSGQCHLDPIAELTLNGVGADVISLCLGINIQGAGSFSGRTFGPQALGFISRVRQANPDAVIAVITPITSPPRERVPNVVDVTLPQMRKALRDAVEVLGRTDSRLHLIEGPDIIGDGEAHLLPDELHPDAEGYELMGQRLTQRLGALLSR